MSGLAAVDAETEAIEDRPVYPPRSVGYAIAVGNKREYWAFGHPTGNNCTRAKALARVREVVRTNACVFHNAPFDCEVMERDGVKPPAPLQLHDTMVESFLDDPHAPSLELKEIADAELGMPPKEQTVLKNWILTNVPEAKKRKSEWPRYICRAPGDLVGVYAKGDVQRTLKLHELKHDRLKKRGMLAAYDRERDVLRAKKAMETGGIRVRLAKLRRDMGPFQRLREKLEVRVRRRLRVGKDFNPNSGEQLADALLQRGLLREVLRTAPTERYPEGQVRTGRDVLQANCTDPELVNLLAMQGVLGTYLDTFMAKWRASAERHDGYVYPSFHTTRSADSWGDHGARTGRLSSSNPNFQNIPNNVEGAVNEKVLRLVAKELRRMGVDFVGMRDYLCPDEGHVLLRRDYKQQELRILAHNDFNERLQKAGKFLQLYIDNPKLDGHDLVQALVCDLTGVLYDRKYIKNTNFGILYGMGAPRLAQRLGIDKQEARKLKRAVLKAVPGIQNVMDRLADLADKEAPFETWGGRKYFCEAPDYIDDGHGGKVYKTFEYKMLNYLIQGSAADCTKVGMIQVNDRLRHGRLVLQVHDELVASVPKQHAKAEMRLMREAMEDVQFRVPMLTDGEVAGVSWGRMREVDW